MDRTNTRLAGKQRKLPLLGVLAALGLAIPSAGLAVVDIDKTNTVGATAFEFFTPASVDPELAARVAEKARERGIRFTPTGTQIPRSDRTVTVAVRVDGDTAQAISVRNAVTEAAPGTGTALTRLNTSRFNLGTARGYQSFARPQNNSISASSVRLDTDLSRAAMPDLSDFAPATSSIEDKPSRLQPRIELEDTERAGRSPNTLDSLATQTVDVGGSFRLSPNLDVTAGVRLSQERDRLDPLTNSVQDSQAVYVGTQIRF